MVHSQNVENLLSSELKENAANNFTDGSSDKADLSEDDDDVGAAQSSDMKIQWLQIKVRFVWYVRRLRGKNE